VRSAEEIDDLTPPPPLQIMRPCSVPGCRHRARAGASECRECNAAKQARWYERNRGKKLHQRRTAAQYRDHQEKLADSARAQLYVYLSRGKIKRGSCVECCSAKVTAYIPDPTQWRKVVWVCRDHRTAVVEGIVDRERQLRERDDRATRREQLFAVFERLPAAEQARIREHAARGPAGLRLAPEAPLYLMQLLAETEKI
jgi:hypothetical protein